MDQNTQTATEQATQTTKSEQETTEYPSAREAARALSQVRWDKARSQQQEQSPVTQAAPESQGAPQPETELPSAETSPVQQDAPDVEPQAEEPEAIELPPIDPPRSWTAEERERFRSLPRETQEYLAEREQERDREVRRRQNEAAEERKAIQCEREAAEQQRKAYEAAIPQLMAAVQASVAGEFADVQTWADVERMASDDPIRYNKWNLQQQKLTALQQEMQAAEQRRAQEHSQNWTKFAQEQDKLFLDRVPEIADPEKGRKLMDSAKILMRDLGFTEDELARAYNGQVGVSLRDHRMQMLITDAVRYREAKAAAKKIVAAPLPKVQKPGAATVRPSQNEIDIANLNKQLETATGNNAVRIATQLERAKRAAASRR